LILAAGIAAAQDVYRRNFYATELQAGIEVEDEQTFTNAVLKLPFNYDFDAGTNYLDASEAVNDGTQATANSRPTFVEDDGTVSAHYDFDGTDDFIEVPDNDALSFGDRTTDSPFSISAWIDMDSADTFQVFGKGALGAPDTGEYQFYTGSGGNLGVPFLVLLDADENNYIFGRGAALSAGAWVHLVATYDGGGTESGIAIYTNGVDATGTPGSVGSYTAMHNTTDPVTIGQRTLFSAVYANGAIDDARIYNRELTAAEVQAIYNATVGAHP